jgi:hypothetical protein
LRQKNVPAPGIAPVERLSDVLLAVLKMNSSLLRLGSGSYRASGPLA